MTSLLLMIGLPLIVFAIVDAYASLKTALICAVIMAIAECVFSYFYFGSLDSTTYMTVLMVIGLAAISYKKNSPLFFKLKPALTSLLFGVILVGSYVIDEALLKTFMSKYGVVVKGMLEGEAADRVDLFLTPAGQNWLEKVTLSTGLFLTAHAGLTAYSAYRWPQWVWLFISIFGFFIFMFLGTISAQFLL